MERSDALLIERLAPEHKELSYLMNRHQGYEAEISKLGGRRFLSNHEIVELKRLKKMKLQGRDRVQAILRGQLATPRATA